MGDILGKDQFSHGYVVKQMLSIDKMFREITITKYQEVLVGINQTHCITSAIQSLRVPKYNAMANTLHALVEVARRPEFLSKGYLLIRVGTHWAGRCQESCAHWSGAYSLDNHLNRVAILFYVLH